jgi:integrase
MTKNALTEARGHSGHSSTARIFLTEAAIKRLKPTSSRQEIAAGLIPGLYLQIEPSGVRSFVLRYRADGRTRKFTLGRWPAIGLGQARQLARDAILAVKQGRDPGTERQQARQAARRPPQPTTFEGIAEAWLAREGARLRSQAFNRRTLERLVYPELGSPPIETIKRSDINHLLDRIEDESGPVMADRTLAIIRRVLNWHAARTDDYRSPIVRGMARTKPRERMRDRILSDSELRAVWMAAETLNGPFGALIHFILLTAARRSEAAGLTRAEIVASDWVLPANRNKTKVEFVRPLSAKAQAVPTKLPQIGEGRFVFTTNGERPISGFSKFKAAVDQASGITGWTLHDLRRTARSLLSRADVDADVAERCLGHVLTGVRANYDRHEFYHEKRHAFEALATLIEQIVKAQPAAVLPFPANARADYSMSPFVTT